MSAYDTSGMLQDMSRSWLQHPDTRTMLERAAELGIDVSSYLAQLSDPGVWNHEAGAPQFVGELRQQMSDKQALKNRRRAQYAAAIMPDEFQAIAAEVEADYLKDAGSEEVITTGFEPEMANAHDVFFGKLQRNSQWQQRLDDYEKRMSQDYGDLWQEYQEAMLDPANDLVSWEEYTRSTPELQMRYENYEKYKKGTQHRDYNMYAPPVRYI